MGMKCPKNVRLRTGHKVKRRGGWEIIYLVYALLVAHPSIAARKFVAHP
jgi:hypothetical protein